MMSMFRLQFAWLLWFCFPFVITFTRFSIYTRVVVKKFKEGVVHFFYLHLGLAKVELGGL